MIAMVVSRVMAAESSPGPSSTLFERLLTDGTCIVKLSPAEAGHLAEFYRESAVFFASDTAVKERYSVPNRVSGYRPHGYAHAGYPDQPDLNDSFLYWQRRRAHLPHQEEISSFLDAAEAFRAATVRIARDVIESMREFYKYEPELPFERASVLQVNSFAEPTDRKLLQQRHEDAILLTVISTSAEGLEGFYNGNVKAVTLEPDEVMVMPGSVMTMMTGGRIEPFYHQVRNYHHLDRKSIIYFVSPDADGAIEPFVRNEVNEGVDIRALVIDNPQTFGLSEDFVTA